jgi:hypothetical protein
MKDRFSRDRKLTQVENCIWRVGYLIPCQIMIKIAWFSYMSSYTEKY